MDSNRQVCSLHQQHPGNEESQGGLAHPLRCSISDVGWEQRPELREDQLQPLEPALPQAAAEPHALRVQGPEAVQYPLGSTAPCVSCCCPGLYSLCLRQPGLDFPWYFCPQPLKHSCYMFLFAVPSCFPYCDTNES